MNNAIKAGLFLTLFFCLLSSTSATAATVQYQYDDLHRLTRVAQSDGTVTVYDYDDLGNRTRKTVTTSSDTTPPTPNPMTWSVTPYAATSTSITMTATTATDTDTPPVSYFFDFVDSSTGGSGGLDSGWQSSTAYVDTKLQPNHQYAYRVKARDSAATANETGYSSTVYRYTHANAPGVLAFSNLTQTSIRANWTGNGNRTGTEYYCENTTKGTNSGWTPNTYWDSSGLVCGNSYSFRVRARNGDGIETGWTDLGSQITLECGALPPTVTTGSATEGDTYATLSGSVNPNGLESSSWFEWGLTTGYGNNTSPQAVGSSSSVVPVEQLINGLDPEITYHYRLVAQNSVGTSQGEDNTFTTGPSSSEYTLTVITTGQGTVTSDPAGINCGVDCSETYADATNVTLTASASEGWEFSGWSGACSGTGDCVVTMNADRSVTATFTTHSGVMRLTDGTWSDTNGYQLGDTVYVEVTDADLNTDSGITDSVVVHVTSDTEDTGPKSSATLPVADPLNVGDGTISAVSTIVSTLTEGWTVTGYSTGFAVKFSVNGSVSGDQGEATTGDKYTSSNGQVSFIISEGNTPFVQGDTFTFTTTAGVPVYEPVALTETGVDTGVFHGSIGLDDSGSGVIDGDLDVTLGDAIWAMYEDAADEWGDPVVVFDTALYSRTVVSGPISADTTWTLANSPYLVSGDVTVENGVTLTIEPGVVVLFSAHSDDQHTGFNASLCELRISGHLVAQGTVENRIIFTSSAANPAPGEWGGIVFYASGGNAVEGIVEYCRIEYGSTGISAWNGATPTIRNSIISHHAGVGIFCHLDSDLLIEGNTISDNETYGIYCDDSSPIINSNDIWNSDTGIYCGGSPLSLSISNNNIRDNITYGIWYNGSGANGDPPQTINGNTVTGNGTGVMLSDWVFNPPVINQNNLYGNTQYDLINNAFIEIDARNNWWGDTAHAEMETGGNLKDISTIYDYYDDSSYGVVNYAGWLDQPRGPFAHDQSVITDEDRTLNITLTGSTDNGQPPTYLLESQPDHGSLTGVAPNLVYTPAANYYGPDGFTFKVNDGTGDSYIGTITITVNPVNDSPAFTKGPDQTVVQDTGAQIVTGWAKDMSPGPANELGQGLTFTVITDNNALFSVLPAVSPTGDLTYTPAAGANGEAGIEVTLKDDGGTANGGVDSSVPQSFMITVNELIADISVDKEVTDRNPDVADEVVFTVSVTNLGPDDATGIQVADQLPAGLTYVADDSGGFYDPGTGIWEVGNLANGEFDSLHITAKVEQKGRITNTATVTASSPQDPNPGNDSDDAIIRAGGNAMPWLFPLLLWD